VAKRDRVLGRSAAGLGKAKSEILDVFAVVERVVEAVDAVPPTRGHHSEHLSKAKSEIVEAFGVVERLMGVVDAALNGQPEPSGQKRQRVAERPEERAPRCRVDARVVGRKSDGTFEVVLGAPTGRLR